MSVLEAEARPGPTETRQSFEVLPAERSFRVMGSDAHVLVWQERDPVVAPEDLLDRAERSLRDLEERWSRFIPTSDVCRLNARAGQMVRVAPETVALLVLANRAREMTAGRFDATLLHELEAAGYDRSFDQLERRRHADRPDSRERSGDHLIMVDEVRNEAATPLGRGIDLGGIGKGRAADIVAAQLLQDGALGVCVNLGGDLRVIGETPGADGILVAVDDPFAPGAALTAVQIRNAAVATSARTRRCWPAGDGHRHHLIDRTTRRPAMTGLAAVTVIAPSAAWAEVAAKATFLGGPPAVVHEADPRLAVPRLLVTDDGGLVRLGGFGGFER